MTPSIVEELYTNHIDAYDAFTRFFRSRQGLRSLIVKSVPIKSGLTVLDAGCGFGMATFAFLDAIKSKELNHGRIYAFDITPALLARFQHDIDRRGMARVHLRQADVLALEDLPSSWRDYDFILTASMLEHLPKHELPKALAALRARLAPDGHLSLMITKRSIESRLLIEGPWHANSYSRAELRSVCAKAGIGNIRFLRFPLRYTWLNRANRGGPANLDSFSRP